MWPAKPGANPPLWEVDGPKLPISLHSPGDGFINDASSRILRKFRLGAFFEPKSGL